MDDCGTCGGGGETYTGWGVNLVPRVCWACKGTGLFGTYSEEVWAMTMEHENDPR